MQVSNKVSEGHRENNPLSKSVVSGCNGADGEMLKLLSVKIEQMSNHILKLCEDLIDALVRRLGIHFADDRRIPLTKESVRHKKKLMTPRTLTTLGRFASNKTDPQQSQHPKLAWAAEQSLVAALPSRIFRTNFWAANCDSQPNCESQPMPVREISSARVSTRSLEEGNQPRRLLTAGNGVRGTWVTKDARDTAHLHLESYMRRLDKVKSTPYPSETGHGWRVDQKTDQAGTTHCKCHGHGFA